MLWLTDKKTEKDRRIMNNYTEKTILCFPEIIKNIRENYNLWIKPRESRLIFVFEAKKFELENS